MIDDFDADDLGYASSLGRIMTALAGGIALAIGIFVAWVLA